MKKSRHWPLSLAVLLIALTLGLIVGAQDFEDQVISDISADIREKQKRANVAGTKQKGLDADINVKEVDLAKEKPRTKPPRPKRPPRYDGGTKLGRKRREKELHKKKAQRQLEEEEDVFADDKESQDFEIKTKHSESESKIYTHAMNEANAESALKEAYKNNKQYISRQLYSKIEEDGRLDDHFTTDGDLPLVKPKAGNLKSIFWSALNPHDMDVDKTEWKLFESSYAKFARKQGMIKEDQNFGERWLSKGPAKRWLPRLAKELNRLRTKILEERKIIPTEESSSPAEIDTSQSSEQRVHVESDVRRSAFDWDGPAQRVQTG